MELLIGCGSNRRKKISFAGGEEWSELVTLDIEPTHRPDVLWNLECPDPLPFADNSFDEIHAYEVLEHTGRQGDWRFFFRQWMDFWRILKPGGAFFGTSPDASSPWAWGDPGHTRVITPECLTFLRQTEYTAQVGISPMTDYRSVFTGDFDLLHDVKEAGQFRFVLKAVKPSRIALEP